MPRRPSANVEAQLAALDELPGERAERVATLEKALAGHYRVAAKAARLAEDSLLYELVPALQGSYTRFLDQPAKHDPSCYAKKALARALVALDCSDVDFLLAGIRYEQREPTYGGTTDTAADVRSTCAMGLVATGYSRALVELTALLNDREAAARIGAVRAIACGNPREAELLLRAKALAGDVEPQVIGECLSGLLAVEPDESIAFAAGFLAHADDVVCELAALALGESRLDGALAPLREAWNVPMVGPERRSALLRAAAAHRSEAALDWLLALVTEARVPIAVEAVDALVLYRHNAKLLQRLATAVTARGEAVLLERLAALDRRGGEMAEPRYAVRRATTADAVELARLAESTFTETFGHLYPPDDLASFIRSYTPAACLAILADPRLAYWLVNVEGEPAVGFALAGYCKLPVANLEPTAGELRQLYVRATHQAKGLGTRLFEAALAWLEQHYAPLYVGVWSNNLGAQRFYGRYGFVKVGEYGFPVGRTVDREFILRR